MYRDIEIIQKDIHNVISLINKLKNHLNINPNDFGSHLNLKSLECRYDELIQELGFAKNDKGLTTFDANIFYESGGNINLNSLSEFFPRFNSLFVTCVNCEKGKQLNKGMKNNPKLDDFANMEVADISTGSLHIVFSPQNNQTTLDSHPIKKGLEIFNRILDCSYNPKKIRNLTDEIGNKPIIEYKRLLNVLIKNELNLELYKQINPFDFNSKCLTWGVAKQINDAIDDSNITKTEDITISGSMYIIDVESKRFGIKYKDKDSNKFKKLKNIKYDNKSNELLKSKLEDEIEIKIKKSFEVNNLDHEESTPIYKLVKIFDK